jgi:hypothetical protein
VEEKRSLFWAGLWGKRHKLKREGMGAPLKGGEASVYRASKRGVSPSFKTSSPSPSKERGIKGKRLPYKIWVP